MSWLWDSYTDYETHITPINAMKTEFMLATYGESEYERMKIIHQNVRVIQEGLNTLNDWGFGESNQSRDSKKYTELNVKNLFIDLVYSCEVLLLYNSKIDKEGYLDFVDKRNMDYINSYKDEVFDNNKLEWLLYGINQVLNAHYKVVENNYGFLDEYTSNFPSTLKFDFKMCQHQFSIGFEDVGLLLASRGLENVVRQIVKRRKIKLKYRNKDESLDTSSLNDLIEGFYCLRWKKNDERLISQETKGLLHYLRQIRNKNAHSSKKSKNENPREKVILIATTAKELWEEIGLSKARLKDAIIQKDW